MNFVVDASVAIKWYVTEIYSAEAACLLAAQNELFAPELFLLEFGNIVWKKFRDGEISESQGRHIIELVLAAGVNTTPDDYLVKAAFNGALTTGQTVYDWSYLALAVSLNCEMVTADKKFYQALETTKLKKHLLFVGDVV